MRGKDITGKPFEPRHAKMCLWDFGPGNIHPASSATQTSYINEILDLAIVCILLSRQQTKRVRVCAG